MTRTRPAGQDIEIYYSFVGKVDLPRITARPIRHNAQVPDRNGQKFFTLLITSLSNISKKGWREAELLADRMSKETIDYFYVSPLGRARDTASCTLKKTGRTAEVCPWLREFEAPIWRPDVKDHRKIPWDWMPADWTGDDRAYRRDQWFEMEPSGGGKCKAGV